MIINEAFKKLQADLPAAERIQRVCVYGGASEGQWDGYVDAAKRLGEVLGEAGLDVGYGGGRTGMMGAMADGALAKDAHVIGGIPEFLDHVEVGLGQIPFILEPAARRCSAAATVLSR